MQTVYFTNIRSGKGSRAQFIYCEVRDAHTNELLIASTLEHACIAASRVYTVVPAFIGDSSTHRT